jgi:hypothetical protein
MGRGRLCVGMVVKKVYIDQTLLNNCCFKTLISVFKKVITRGPFGLKKHDEHHQVVRVSPPRPVPRDRQKTEASRQHRYYHRHQ